MSDDKEFNGYLKKIVEASYEKIVDSGIFMQLLSHEGAKKAPEILLQMGIAILHDKPIGLVVANGVEVPKHLQKIAFTIEYFDEGDKTSFEAAAQRVLKMAEIADKPVKMMASKEDQEKTRDWWV